MTIASNSSLLNNFLKFFISSDNTSTWFFTPLFSIFFLAISDIISCISIPTIFAFDFFANNNEIIPHPVPISNIFFVFRLILTKSASKTESKVKFWKSFLWIISISFNVVLVSSPVFFILSTFNFFDCSFFSLQKLKIFYQKLVMTKRKNKKLHLKKFK